MLKAAWNTVALWHERAKGRRELRELTPDQLHRLDHLKPAAGERHDETNMATIDR